MWRVEIREVCCGPPALRHAGMPAEAGAAASGWAHSLSKRRDEAEGQHPQGQRHLGQVRHPLNPQLKDLGCLQMPGMLSLALENGLELLNTRIRVWLKQQLVDDLGAGCEIRRPRGLQFNRQEGYTPPSPSFLNGQLWSFSPDFLSNGASTFSISSN